MPKSFWEQIATTSGQALRSLPPESRAVVVLSAGAELDAEAEALLEDCVRVLQSGGLLFIYGLPRELPSWAEHLARAEPETWRMIFKYWIALDIDDAPPVWISEAGSSWAGAVP